MCTFWCCWLPWASSPASAPSQTLLCSWCSMASLLSTFQVSWYVWLRHCCALVMLWCLLLHVAPSLLCACHAVAFACCIVAAYFSGVMVRTALPLLCACHPVMLAAAPLLAVYLPDIDVVLLMTAAYCLGGCCGVFRCLTAVYFTQMSHCIAHTSVLLALHWQQSLYQMWCFIMS